MNFFDSFLGKITMYRLVLYYLIFLLAVAIGFSAFGVLPYSPFSLLWSAFFITSACWVVNIILARIFNAPTNVESVFITALILVLIISPNTSAENFKFYVFASMIAVVSKYVLTIGKKHIFNPAAIAVVVTALATGQSASWWVGTTAMMPFVFIGGLLVVRKIVRFDFVITFILVALSGIIGSHFANPAGLLSVIEKVTVSSPLFFFAFVMLTEPLTTPPTSLLRVCYGALVGFLFVPTLHIGSIYSTPELALVIGNIFSYFVSPKYKLLLTLKEVKPISADCYDFIFTSPYEFNFNPGQYLEWTLKHPRPDRRGNRRYFTISSAPGGKEIVIGLKFYQDPSSFKKTLLSMKPGNTIMASQLAGDFVLPRNKEQKLAFIAGGIGITPFHSMIVDLLNRSERRPIVLFNCSRTNEDFAYTNDFDTAELELGIKTIYVIAEEKSVPTNWKGEKGFLTKDMIIRHAPDYLDRIFYLSGPHSMVVAFENTLQQMGVSRKHIKTDFFPGLV